MQRPCSVFATFETEEGYERATRYNDLITKKEGGIEEDDYSHYETILGEHIHLEEASEPSDIIWENR
jgi:hypothetical protein